MAGSNIKKNFDRVIKKIESKSKQRLEEALEHNKKKVKDKLSRGSGGGRTYEINGKMHTASAPDEPPAELRGNLSESIAYKIEEKRGDPEGVIGSTYFTSFWMEFGTERMRPRPFLGETLEEERRQTMRILGRTWF